MDGMTLEERLKQQAHTLGFELAGIAPATEADGFDRLRDWLAHEFGGEMGYMQRHADARRHPSSILPKVRSVVMVGMNYHVEKIPNPKSQIRNQEQEQPARSASEGTPASHFGFRISDLGFPAGRVASYAYGSADYHDVLRERLDRLLAWVQQEVPDCRGRGVVDTAPLLERDFARRAGLGWFGKNTMLLNKRIGSFFFLGALLLDIELKADAPHTASHCGTCTACLDACPTQAFPKPGVLDARRCISYLTIELKDSVPEDLRGGLGDWVF